MKKIVFFILLSTIFTCLLIISGCAVYSPLYQKILSGKLLPPLYFKDINNFDTYNIDIFKKNSDLIQNKSIFPKDSSWLKSFETQEIFGLNNIYYSIIDEYDLKLTPFYQDTAMIKSLLRLKHGSYVNRTLIAIDTISKDITIMPNSELWKAEDAQFYETQNYIYINYVARGGQGSNGDTIFLHPGIYLINKSDPKKGYNYIFSDEEPLLIQEIDSVIRVVTNKLSPSFAFGALFEIKSSCYTMRASNIFIEYYFNKKLKIISRKRYDINKSKEKFLIYN